jgi:tetratricopeptide (TPR) repeat protein
MQGKGLLSQMLRKTSPAKGTAYSETYYPRNTFGWSELSAYVDGRYKYIDAPRPELYDLTADPGETQNLYHRQRALAESLRARLLQLQQRTTSATNPAPAGPDPQRIEALRALGYVAVAVPLQRKPGQAGLIDPKDRVRTFNKILLGMQESDAGAFEKSDALLGEALREDPDLFIAHYSLGVNKLKSGENEKALEYFSRAKSLNPDFDLTDMNRASALARLNRLDEAVAVLQEVLRRLPSRLEAKRQLGLLYSRKKDHLKAIATYQDILSSRPEDAEATKYLGIALVDAERYEEGGASLRKAIARGAEDALVYNFLGIALGNTGRREEAIGAYRKALAIKQDYYQARLNLSFALLKSGQEAEARKEFSTVCQANPRFCDPYRKYFP